MSDYNEGDLVEAVKGKSSIRGLLVKTFSGLSLQDVGWSVEGLRGDDWTVTVIERAKPALPTEPGAYKYDGGWCHVAVLNDVGEWRDVYGNRLTVTHLDASSLTRLKPVAETAKKVLDRVEQYLMGAVPLAALNDLRREFGVTGELGE
jgi:hypothetical protein